MVPVGEVPHYQVVFDNSRVRICHARIAPGDATPFRLHAVDYVGLTALHFVAGELEAA